MDENSTEINNTTDNNQSPSSQDQSTNPKNLGPNQESILGKPASLLKKLSLSLSSKRDQFKSFWQTFSSRKKILLATSTSLVTIALLTVLISLNREGKLPSFLQRPSPTGFQAVGDWKRLEIPDREPPFFLLEAQTQSTYGILPKEVFILKSKEPVTEQFIRQNIQSSAPIQITARNDQEVTISPQSPLGLDKVFKVQLAVEGVEHEGHTFDRDYSWAYQTQGKFRVISNIPGDKKNNVPINTGIELVFSQDDYEDPSPFISIEPKINYRLERHGDTLAIVPQAPLIEKFVYRVTLKAGLKLESRDDPISEDYSFTFQTKEKEERPARVSIDVDFAQIVPNEEYMAKVFALNWKPEDVLKAQVYQFPSSQEYLDSRKKIDEVLDSWRNYYAEEEAVETSNLSKVLEADIQIQNKENISFIQLPQALPEGYYLVQLWYEDGTKLEQIWLQSTFLSGYVSAGKEQSIVWANIVNSQPASLANIQVIDTGLSYSTSQDGIARFNTPEIFFEKGRHYLEITNPDQKKLLLPVRSLGGNARPNQKTADDYWSYLYNERRMYKPNDTVYFWGVIKEKDSNFTPSATLSLSIGYQRGESDVLKKTVNPQPDGTFLESFALVDAPTGWYTLSLSVNDLQITSLGFQVLEYEKPEMKIEVDANKKAIFTDQTVKYTSQVKFFDETPASNIPIKIHESQNNKTSELETSLNGEATFTYTPVYKTGGYNYPRYESITITPALAEQATIEGHGSVYVYGSKVMISTENEQENDKAKLIATVNHVDLSGMNAGTTNEVKGSPSQNHKVNLKITKQWSERKEAGVYYDFIEKVTRPRYQYIQHKEIVEDIQMNTDQNGQIYKEFQMEPRKSYRADISIVDSDNHETNRTEWYYYYPGRGEGSYSEQRNPELTVNKDENSYSVGELIDAKIIINDEDYPDNDKNRFLFIIAKKGEQKTIVSESPNTSFIFEQIHIPNIYLAAISFTGRYYEAVSTPCRWGWSCYSYYGYGEDYFSGLEIRYKQLDSQLDLEIIPSQSSFEPGRKASISVRVKKDESPISNASVNLALIDQALAAIGGVREPNILPSLYETESSFIYYTYNSHKPLFPDKAQAEKGGGGGMRELFKDTAFFGKATTNAEGYANFEFDLPDNITSWIIYAQALSGNVDAGQLESSLIVSKDFFVTSQFPREYLNKEKPYITGNSFGNALSSSDTVQFEAIFLNGEEEVKKENKTATAFKPVNFAFPFLPLGEYKVTLSGHTSSYDDGIALPFNVLDTRFVFNSEEKSILNKGDRTDAVKQDNILEERPVTVVISDEGKGSYYRNLTRFCYLYSNRLEKQLARIAAGNILFDKYNDTSCQIQKEDITKFQNEDGGLAQVNWGGSHLKSTAWALYIHSESFDKAELISYLEAQLAQSRGGTIQQIYAAWGLSSLDEPEVNRLRALADSATTFEEKVVAGIALASSGEVEVARDLYYDILADYAYTYTPYIRIQAEDKKGNQLDSYIQDTSLALLLGNLVEKQYNDGFYEYLRDYKTQAEDIVLDLGDIAFITSELEKLPEEDTAVTFTSNARNLSKTLEGGRNWVLNLEKNELNNSTVEVTDGKAEVTTTYFVGPDKFAQAPSDDRLTLKRTYSKARGEGDSIVPGDIIQVTIDFNLNIDTAPLGGYTITDYLPSGLTYIKNPSAYGLKQNGWIRESERNIMNYSFYNSPWWQVHGSRQLVYYARANAVGTYIAEPIVFQSTRALSVFSSVAEEPISINERK